MTKTGGKQTYRSARHVDVHCTATQMHEMCHERRDGIGRRRVVRAEAVRVSLVTRVQHPRDRSIRSDSGQRSLGEGDATETDGQLDLLDICDRGIALSFAVVLRVH
jgi:hypothetical protein